jgi:hypothetical protein
MHGTVLRCEECGLARETKRYRDGIRDCIQICFCLPWRGKPPFVEVTQSRVLTAPGLNLVQRE